jgi:Zn-dependent protease with chaperone function
LIVLLFYPIIAAIMRKKALAMVHGSGIRVSDKQFPEIQKCLIKFKERLGITDDVSVYIVEDNIANAFVVKYGKKNVVLLTDDIIHGCIASGNPKALSFVIGHELGHIALKHNGVLRSWLSKRFKKLSRLDEYSADAVGNALVQDKTIAFNGLLLLTVGYAMMPYVNYETVIAQAQEVASNKYSKKAERSLTHPLLLNRLYRILR